MENIISLPSNKNKNVEESEDIEIQGIEVHVESNRNKHCIIHHIARYILLKKIEQNENIYNFLKENSVYIRFVDSQECNGDSSNNTIELGVRFLEKIFTLCTDLFNGNSELAYLFIKKQERECPFIWFETQSMIKEDVFPHIISCNANPDSLDSIDIHKVYRVFSESLWFVFLHELGHIFHNHKKVADTLSLKKQEEQADDYAIKYMHPNTNCEGKAMLIGILATIGIIFINEEQNSHHPSSIGRLVKFLNAFASNHDDTIWKKSYELLKHLSQKYDKNIGFKHSDGQSYKQALEMVIKKTEKS